LLLGLSPLIYTDIFVGLVDESCVNETKPLTLELFAKRLHTAFFEFGLVVYFFYLVCYTLEELDVVT
jgi:hypothetical protein